MEAKVLWGVCRDCGEKALIQDGVCTPCLLKAIRSKPTVTCRECEHWADGSPTYKACRGCEKSTDNDAIQGEKK